MPFEEHRHAGAARAGRRQRAACASTQSVQDAAAAPSNIVITLGTPSSRTSRSTCRDIRTALDDLLPVLRPGHTLVLRSTVAPGTTEFVAGYLEQQPRPRDRRRHVRRARAGADRRPAASSRRSTRCRASSAASASAPASASRELFEVFGAPIVQTTPVQAELAKIWTNILRYTHFALPNLLMMDCEQYGANVFEVIDLINRDYPRGGIARPGPHRRHLPAQGLRVLARSAPTRRACCWPSRASTSRVPLLPRRGHEAPARRRCAAARSPCSGSTFKRDTDDERDSLVAQADPPARARARGRRRPRPARRRRRRSRSRTRSRDADAVVVATNHSAFEQPDRCAAIAAPPARLPRRRPLERARRRPGVRVRDELSAARDRVRRS